MIVMLGGSGDCAYRAKKKCSFFIKSLHKFYNVAINIYFCIFNREIMI